MGAGRELAHVLPQIADEDKSERVPFVGYYTSAVGSSAHASRRGARGGCSHARLRHPLPHLLALTVCALLPPPREEQLRVHNAFASCAAPAQRALAAEHAERHYHCPLAHRLL
jgi:hypothetical protein